MLQKQRIYIKITQRIKNDFGKDADLFCNVEHKIPNAVLFFFSLLISHLPYPGHESHHSPPSSARAKNEWSYNTTSYILHHGMVNEKLHLYLLSAVFTNLWAYVK